MNKLGAMHAASFATDPKHLGFVLARYKFVSKMLVGVDSVLEIGCGDGTGAHVVLPVVTKYTGIDCDAGILPSDGLVWRQWNIVTNAFPGTFDAVYALDVLEHISPKDEDRFFTHIKMSLKPRGFLIIGTPSLESQPYASSLSKLHHVNCKTEDGLRATLACYFHNVFLFGMQDETLHCGYGPMTHYRLALCACKR